MAQCLAEQTGDVQAGADRLHVNPGVAIDAQPSGLARQGMFATKHLAHLPDVTDMLSREPGGPEGEWASSHTGTPDRLARQPRFHGTSGC